MTEKAKDAIDAAAKALVSQILLHTDQTPEQESALQHAHVAWDHARRAIPVDAPGGTA